MRPPPPPPVQIAFGVVLVFYIFVNIAARVVRTRRAKRKEAEYLASAVADPTPPGTPLATDANGGGSAKESGGSGAGRVSAQLVFGPDGLKRSRGGGDGDGAAELPLKDGDKDKDKAKAGADSSGSGAGGGKVAERADPVVGLVGRIGRVHALQLEQMASLTEQASPPLPRFPPAGLPHRQGLALPGPA